MCEQLKKELEHGRNLAAQLVEHTLNMGASKGAIPVEIGGYEYRVSVESIGKKNDAD